MPNLSALKQRLDAWRKTAAPVRLIVISFVLLILLGCLLLILPVSSAAGAFTHPLDALFTATSATCVTGLSVVDTTSHWSPFGCGRWSSPGRPAGATCPTPRPCSS